METSVIRFDNMKNGIETFNLCAQVDIGSIRLLNVQNTMLLDAWSSM
jgi:hypothetical protein